MGTFYASFYAFEDAGAFLWDNSRSMIKSTQTRMGSLFGGGERYLLPVLAMGLALRWILGGQLGPLSGDPIFSYSYRALLLSHGQWAGLFKMWHPPGYPALLALLHTLSGYSLSPYLCGRALNLGCYVALSLIVDSLIRSRVSASSRLIAATCLAFWETLFYWESVAVTEPLYAVLLYATLACLFRWDGKSLRALCTCGLLIGLAATLRREALAPLAGLSLWILMNRRRSFLPLLASFWLGYLLVAGWTFLDPLLLIHLKAQEFSFTVPPVQGLVANLLRAVECGYRACVDWLPQVLLLPFWMVAAAGFFYRLGDKAWDKIHSLFLLSLLPALLAVVLTIQHKRTGFFLIPAAAVYFALGCEWFLRQLSQRWAKWERAACAAILVVIVVQSGRILWRLRKFPPTANQQITYVQAELAKLSAVPPGKVWAFGNEPEIYAYWGQAIDYPFDQRDQYARVYADQAGNPAGFIQSLRHNGVRYLTFSLSPVGRSGNTEPQMPYGITEPLRSDLVSIQREAPALGLALRNMRELDKVTGSLYFFEIIDDKSRP